MQTTSLQTLRRLWANLMLAAALFGVMSFFEWRKEHIRAPGLAILVGIGALAVVEALLSFVVPAIKLKTAFQDLEAEIIERPAAADESAMFGGASRLEKVFKHPGNAFTAALARYQQPLIQSIALSELVAANGALAAWFGFGPSVFLPFVAAGFVLVAIRFPAQDRIIALIEKGTGARFPMKEALH